MASSVFARIRLWERRELAFPNDGHESTIERLTWIAADAGTIRSASALNPEVRHTSKDEVVTAKRRVPIDPALAAEITFAADRTCCVCRVRGRPIQIHHIDEDPANNETSNIVVLCLDCHDDTQLRGGFGRRLNAAQVREYRQDWLTRVRHRRDRLTL